MATLSRTPSPRAPGSDSDSDSVVATPLTPRSKLRALYATLDGGDSSDSDEEHNQIADEKENKTPSKTAKSKSSSRHSSRSGTPPRTLAADGAAVLGASSPKKSNLDSDSDSDDVPAGPRGRFAARMLGDSAKQPAPAPAPEAPLADNARERVKRMLEQAAQAEKKQTADNDHDHDHENDAEDEDEDLPIVARHRKLANRPARRSASPPQREASPDMFMTPTKPTDREDSPAMFMTPSRGGDDDAAAADQPGRAARFQALVAKKREEARAREAEDERKRAARAARMAAEEAEDDDMLMRDDDDDAISDITDDDGGRKLTQELRPARKASKKALEEMHRETQRMSRNLQLAHEAKTRKKITKESLFERFNFKPEGSAAKVAPAPAAVTAAAAADPPAMSSSRPTSPVSASHDAMVDEAPATEDTPPSSPPVALAGESFSDAKESAAAAAPAVPPPQDKGKGKEVAVVEETPEVKPARRVRIRLPVQANVALVDDELEIVQTTKNKLDILFDNAPLKREKENRSMLTLRRLAQIGSPERNRKPKESNVLTLGELQQQLQEKARRQAKLEREQRLETLRAKGIRIQTEEEREKEMAEVEDIVARARQEAEEIMQREKEAAKEAKKKQKKENGDADDESEADPLAWDDSDEEDGEDYEPPVEEKDIELSGSEEDEEEEVDEDDDVMGGVVIDDAAESGEESEDGKPEEEPGQDVREVLPTPTRPRPVKRRAAMVISDDEDDDVVGGVAATPSAVLEAKTPAPKTAMAKSPFGLHSDSPQVPTSVLRSATKSFIPGLPIAVGGPAGLGLTQIFAGTMADDSQLAGSASGFGSPSQFMPTIGNFAGVEDSLDPSHGSAKGPDVIRSSQPTQDWVKQVQDVGDTGSQAVKLDFSQSQVHGLGSLLRDVDISQMDSLAASQDMPSQDMASQDYTPLKVRFIEHQTSTIATEVLEQTQIPTQTPTSSPPLRRGKLHHRRTLAEDSEDEEKTADAQSAFSKMKEAVLAKKKHAAAAAAAFDRKKSKAKDMVEEQAEESEDEYAGLGGADGEDSDDESLASVKDLIDDDQKVSEADNAKLAAFYADREREHDEKQVEKLFRDVTTGMLRRKRGADYDLSDSDDDGEARRRMKRRQFARMQKALFADERVSKVAENPRNQAFLRTIEDIGSDDEMDFILEHPATESSSAGASAGASASASTVIPDSQPAAREATTAPAEKRPNRRRQSASGKKPANLGEIRETLSSLLDEGSNLSMVADTEFGSDHEEDKDDQAEKDKESRQQRRVAGAGVVDRISLKRDASSGLQGASGRAAFGTGLGSGTMGPTGFRAPALLRRATTNSLISHASSSSTTTSSSSGAGAGFADQGKIRKNASKQSGIHYFARENERRAAMAEGEKRRLAKKVRNAEDRSRVVGGLFGAGKFE